MVYTYVTLVIYTHKVYVYNIYIDDLGNDDHHKPQTRVLLIVPNIYIYI
jgi:hypothetical protein